MNDDLPRTVSIPKDTMPLDKFLRHAGLVTSRFNASIVRVGKLAKVNGQYIGRVQAGDIVTLAQLPSDGGSVSWEPKDVTVVRIVGD